MSDMSNLANLPIEFELSGKKYKVRRLSLLDYFAEFQSLVKHDYLMDTIKMAELIKDSNERISFQVQAMRNTPKGEDLEDAAFERVGTIQGGSKILELVLKKDNTITDVEIEDILRNIGNLVTIKTIILYARGVDITEDKQDKVEPPEKKTP